MRISPTFAIAVVIFAAMPAHTEPSQGSSSLGLTATLDAYGGFILAEAGRHLKGSVLDIGHMEISIAEGTATPIHAKNGVVAGLYITGSGGWTYKSAVPVERAVLETNRYRVARGLHSTQDGVSDTFSRLIVIFSEPLWTKEWDAAAGATGALESPQAGSSSDCEAEMRSVRATEPALDFLLTQARVNGVGRYIYIEFSGGTERIGYTLDEVFVGREELFGFRKLANYHARFVEPIASHKVEGSAGGRTVTASLRHADLSISTADNKRGTISTDLDIRVTGPKGARLVAFHLVNSRDPDSTDWDSKVNHSEARRVVDGQGHDLPFAHRYNILLVEIPPLADGPTDIKMRVETEGEVFLDWKGHHSDSFFVLFGDWYPQPVDWRADRRLTFSLKVRSKKPWRPVTSGTETALREGDDWIETESRSDKPVTFIQVLAAKYVTQEETIDGRKIRVHAYSMARKNVLENLPKLAGAFIQFYSQILGPMEADELDIVEAPEYELGISPSGVIIMPTEAFRPHDEKANPYVRGINKVLAHEIAHQWFGNKAVPANDEDDWLSESLAEYWSGLAIGAMLGDKKGVEDFPSLLAGWRGEAPNCENTGPISSVEALSGDQWFRDRYCLLYNRGPLVVHMLRTLIGNERFFAASKAYLDRATTGMASTDDFAKAVSDTVNADMSWFFDDWIRQGGTPDLKINYEIANGHLAGTVSESGNGGFKRLYVPFVVDVGGHKEVRLVFVDHPQTTFSVPVPASARDVQIDPGRNNLVKYR